MKVYKAFRLRLYPTTRQDGQLRDISGLCRWLWNHLLAENIKKYVAERKFNFWLDMAKTLPELKQKHDWLKVAPSHSLSRCAFYLDRALRNSFKKKGGKNGFPRFKKKAELNDAFYLPSTRFKIDKRRIRLSKVGFIKFRSGELPHGKILSATIKQDGARWFCTVVCEVEMQKPKHIPQKAIGIDLGLKSFLVTSDGECIDNPKHLQRMERRLRLRQRSLSRSKKGSNRRKKKLLIVQNTHRKVRDRRANFLHQTSSRLIAKNGTICVEDLSVQDMQKNRYLAKSIGDAGWGEFLRQLEYKSEWYGRDFRKLEKFTPTTKICSKCGELQAIPLSKRIYSCNCGLQLDRDLNAALNILKIGMSPTLRSRGSNARGEVGARGHSRKREYEQANLIGLSRR